MYALLIHERKLKSIASFNTFIFYSFKMKITIKTNIQIVSKGHQYYIQSIIEFLY